MNNRVPDWIMEEDLRSFHDLFPLPNDKKSTQEDHELVELLWRNGHLVMQSQSNRRHQEHTKLFKRNDHKPNSRPIVLHSLIQQEDWLHYAVDDPLEEEFGSCLLHDIPVTTINSSIKNNEDMSPPKFSQITSSLVNAELLNSTVGSNACGSSQAQNQNEVSYILSRELKENITLNLTHDEAKASTFDTTLTSSSGQLSTSSLNRKRKERDEDDPECHGEEAEYESVEAKKTTKQKSSSRKSRAAEVHNLSERRRRDRINEKMRALQELIPRCNKSDKASMLDEAIEYLKSLQLQLQLMWMGSGMAPMIFPSVQQYMSQVSLPSNQSPLIRSSLVNHSLNQMPMHSSSNLNPAHFPTQIQNAHMAESYARYFEYPHMQMPSQGMNLCSYGSHMMQQNQTPVVVGSSSLSTSVIPSQNIQNGHLG